MSPLQNRVIHGLLAKTNLLKQKNNIVMGITKGRTSRSSQMNFEEAAMMITFLNSKNKNNDPKHSTRI